MRRYVEAFERYDIEALVALLHEDAVQSMPPFAMWIRGAQDIGRFMLEPAPSGCRGSRLLPAAANGCPAFGQYRRSPDGGYSPWALQVLEISDGRIAGMSFFLALLDPVRLFPAYGLALRLDADGRPVPTEGSDGADGAAVAGGEPTANGRTGVGADDPATEDSHARAARRAELDAHLGRSPS